MAAGYFQRIGDLVDRNIQFTCQLFGRRTTLVFLFKLREGFADLIQRTDREKEIIQMFFGIGQQEMTLEEIGDKFGLTRERVRQIKEKAIRRLRQSNRSKLLKSYLG